VADFTSLKTPGTQIGDSQLTGQLRTNICAFLDWALLGLGGFYNVYLGTTLPYGGNPSTLRLSDDPRYPSGQVWDGYKTNWIWENNIENTTQPIQISGVWINGNFLPNNHIGISGFNINYPAGRVFFNSPIPTNSTVQVEYSWRAYNVYPDNIQWFKQLQQGTSRLDNPQWSYQGSGIWSIFPESRAQLPAIVVEPIPTRTHTGYQLGGGQWLNNRITFWVLSNTETQRDSILDILTYQADRTFYLFDINRIQSSGQLPLNQWGHLINSSSTYPYLINNYLWVYALLNECPSQKLSNNAQSIFWGVAHWDIQLGMVGV
jgi:hypothetical protein